MLNAKNPWQELLEDYSHHCVSLMGAFAREEWGFPETWDIETFVRFTAPRRSRKGKLIKRFSRGGVHWSRKKGGGLTPFVSLQLNHLRTSQTSTSFPFGEYDHIINDPEIGSLLDNKIWERYIAALCAHEVAHAVQHSAESNKNATSWLRNLTNDGESHGEYWQEIYRVLRIKFVNDYDALPNLPKEARLKRPKRHTHNSVIGRVFINLGEYRNAPVYGNFDLVKSWQAKKEYYRDFDHVMQKFRRGPQIDFGEGKNGFVTIYSTNKVRVIRVSCDRNDVVETLDEKDNG